MLENKENNGFISCIQELLESKKIDKFVNKYS